MKIYHLGGLGELCWIRVAKTRSRSRNYYLDPLHVLRMHMCATHSGYMQDPLECVHMYMYLVCVRGPIHVPRMMYLGCVQDTSHVLRMCARPS